MPKIDRIYAFITTDKDSEDEGIVARRIGDFWMPLIGADEARVEIMRYLAKDIAKITGKPVVLAKFTNREDIEELEP